MIRDHNTRLLVDIFKDYGKSLSEYDGQIIVLILEKVNPKNFRELIKLIISFEELTHRKIDLDSIEKIISHNHMGRK